MLTSLNPWQLLLWIVCLEFLSLPILSALISSVFSGYFRAKEKHTSNVTNAVVEALKKTAESITKKTPDKKED